MINKGPFFICENNIYGEVIVSLMQHKSNPDIISFKNIRGERHTNAWIINKTIGLQIKYSLIPENKSDWTHFTYEFHDSDPILKFDDDDFESNNYKLFLCLFAINDDVSAKKNHLFYLPFNKSKYYPHSKSKLLISLFIKKGYSPCTKIYFGKESEEEIRTSWNKFPGILFE